MLSKVPTETLPHDYCWNNDFGSTFKAPALKLLCIFNFYLKVTRRWGSTGTDGAVGASDQPPPPPAPGGVMQPREQINLHFHLHGCPLAQRNKQAAPPPSITS